jgi:hypothetical protein
MQQLNFQTPSRYKPYIDFLLSVFISRTGRISSDYADLGPGNRMFTLLRDTVKLSLPAHGFTPVVSNTQTCRVNIETARASTTGIPEDFRIERFNRVRPCANF